MMIHEIVVLSEILITQIQEIMDKINYSKIQMYSIHMNAVLSVQLLDEWYQNGCLHESFFLNNFN